MCVSGEVKWHNQPFSVRTHTSWVYYVCWRVQLSILTLSKLSNLHIFCVMSLFWRRCWTKSEGIIPTTCGAYWWPFFVPSLCVKSSHSAVGHTFPSTPSCTCCVLVFEWIWPSVLRGTLTPLRPSLRFSYSPVTLISMCPEQYEWVSVPPATPRLQTGMPINATSFTPLTPRSPPP